MPRRCARSCSPEPPRPRSCVAEPMSRVSQVGLIVSLALGDTHHRTGTMNQQRSQIRIAPLADAQQQRLAAAGMLPRDQSQPGCQLACHSRSFRVPDRWPPRRWPLAGQYRESAPVSGSPHSPDASPESALPIRRPGDRVLSGAPQAERVTAGTRRADRSRASSRISGKRLVT